MSLQRSPYGTDYHARPWSLTVRSTGQAIPLCWEDCWKERPTRFWTEDSE